MNGYAPKIYHMAAFGHGPSFQLLSYKIKEFSDKSNSMKQCARMSVRKLNCSIHAFK